MNGRYGAATIKTERARTAGGAKSAVRALSVLIVAAPYLPFMFLGTCFYNLQHRHWTAVRAVAVGSLLAMASTVNFLQLHPVSGFPQLFFFANGLLALLIFAAAYRFQDRIPYSRVLNWLAEISYPLYVVHGFAGYVLLTVLTEAGCPPYPAIAIAVATFLLVAYLLHLGVEKPSMWMAKRILNPRWNRRPAGSNAA